MKKTFILILFCALISAVKAQYTTQIVCGPSLSPTVNFVYLGSLNLPVDNSANCQKLQVDILGGTWFSSSIGQTTFYIANRGGLTVNQVVQGSSGFSGASLVAYANPDGYSTDFYLNINSSTAFFAFAVRSYYMQGLNATPLMVAITTQTAIPIGTPITLTVNPVMITDPNGNIGLNTANPDPAYKLSVNGSIRAKEVKVETGWADYVFDKQYPLKSLKEVETYINQNKHLPDVPSASEVQKNGIKVGETESLLLKKIEELTLYLIEKDKQLQKEQETNRSQQNQIDELKKLVDQLTKQK